MKTLNIALGFLVFLASILAAPAVLGSVVAGAAGLLLMVSAGQVMAAPVVAFTAPAAIVRTVDESPPIRSRSSSWKAAAPWWSSARSTASWSAAAIASKGGCHV